jgi:hypothetical protein
MKIKAEEHKRKAHMDSAAAYMVGICRDAELRGLSGYEVAVALATVLAGREPDLAGEILYAVGNAIRLNPVTKIVTPEPGQSDSIN